MFRSAMPSALRAACLLLGSLVLTAGPAPAEVRSFLHVVTAGNLGCSGGFCTYFDDPCLDASDGAMALVTHVWNPPGQPTTYVDQPIAHDLEGPPFRHRLVTGITTLSAGTGFHVVALCGESVHGLPHNTGVGTVLGARSYIHHFSVNGEADAALVAFGNGTPGFVIDSPYGLLYDPTLERWAIFLEDDDPMPTGKFFWVLPSTSSAWERLGLTSLMHEATDENTQANYTHLDHPDLNGRSGAILVVAQQGLHTGGVSNSHYVGVYYDADDAKWAIFNEDQDPMPLGARFVVFIASLIADGDFETGGPETWSDAVP